MIIDDLDSACLNRIFRCLSAAEMSQAACVSKHWSNMLADESLWKDACQADWGLTSAFDPSLDSLPSFRRAYAIWQTQFASCKTPSHTAVRTAKAWKAMKSWYDENMPGISETLMPGLSDSEIDQKSPAGKPHTALRALYRFCGGQDIDYISNAIFGGVIYYNHCTFCRMLEAKQGMQVYRARGRSIMPFAAIGGDAFFAVDIHNGEILNPSEGRFQPVSPPSTTFTDWLEEFARRLTSGVFQVDTYGTHYRFVSTFPRTQECGMREAITEGVRVRVSTVYVPHGRASGNVFAYSVEFYLLPKEEQRQYWPGADEKFKAKSSVQLLGRKWNIRNARHEIVDEIEGEGVIGMQPKLNAGGEAFEYQSCTSSQGMKGYMDGHFTFAIGDLSTVPRELFHAQCPQFVLEIPAYTF